MPTTLSVYFGNLSFQTTEADLRLLCGPLGVVRRVFVPSHPDTGRPKGFAFVQMGTAEEAARVVATLHGAALHGRRLTVEPSAPREER